MAYRVEDLQGSIARAGQSSKGSRVPNEMGQVGYQPLLKMDHMASSGKAEGRGICLLINNSWRSDMMTLASYCSLDLECLMVKCRPCYLPREFTSTKLTAGYIPPHAEVKGTNTLDHCYTAIKDTYHSMPHMHFGKSDHKAMLLFPPYHKMKQLIIDFRKRSVGHTPVCINRAEVEDVNSFRFPGVNVNNNLSWSIHVDTTVKKAHQRLYFLKRRRKFRVSTMTLMNFYR
eukprot:g48047.t1